MTTRSGHQKSSYATGTDVKSTQFLKEKKNLNGRIYFKYAGIKSRMIIIKGTEKKHDICGLDVNGSEYDKRQSAAILTANLCVVLPSC